jgi:hypothetical protein
VPIIGIVTLSFLEQVQDSSPLFWSFFGVTVILVIWTAALFGYALRCKRHFTLEVALRRQHYVQACAQILILLYWGWYWNPVYESAYLIAVQLLFAYTFDVLLQWSRRDTYILGFGPFPIIFSINLFFWFKPDWFHLQFLMVALGFAAKELIRRNKAGCSVHIFNPSSFPLAVFSLGLMITGGSDLTWGQEIASTQFYPPHMYIVLFLLGLPSGFLFGVASMTLSAVVTTYAFGLIYFSVTGVYYFYDTYIPIAVFLGMNFLFNDPSTSPRTQLGRIMFGVCYGLSTVALYGILGSMGVPTFYDKLIPVPILNLAVRFLDRIAHPAVFRRVNLTIFGSSWWSRNRNLSYVSVWIISFIGISAVHGVGDSHRGQWLPFWQTACKDGRPYACSYLEDMYLNFCENDSGWSCNELGIFLTQRDGNDISAKTFFDRGCELRFSFACANRTWVSGIREEPQRAGPTLRDLPIVLRGSKGPVVGHSPERLYSLACERGWADICAQIDITSDP